MVLFRYQVLVLKRFLDEVEYKHKSKFLKEIPYSTNYAYNSLYECVDIGYERYKIIYAYRSSF
jgi:hypothetical protein